MSKYSVTANLETNVALIYTDCELHHARWVTQPSGKVDAGSSQILQANNHKGSTERPVGWVSYVAADGTQFKFSFKASAGSQNVGSSSMTNVQGPYTLPLPDYPTSGKSWSVTYHVELAGAAFIDTPVFAEDVVKAARCEDYSDDRVIAMLGERKQLYLNEVLAADIPREAKLWCAVSPLFLTPSSKAILTRDLAQLGATKLHSPAAISVLMFDRALQASHDFHAGSLGLNELRAVRKMMLEQARAARAHGARDAELVCLMASLAEQNPVESWIHAVSCYLGDDDDGQSAERIDDVLRIVTERLGS